MKEYLIKNNDRGQCGDITKKLREILSQCKTESGDKIVRFEKGEYHFYWESAEENTVYASNTDTVLHPKNRSAINIDGIRNLTIDGCGSEFIMHGRMIALRISESDNISLRNFSWDFPTAGTFQMDVKSVGRYYAEYYIPKSLQWKIEKGNIRWYENSVFTGEEYWHVIGQNDSHCVVGYNSLSGNVSRYPLTKGPLAHKLRIKQTGENTVRISYFKPTDRSLYFEGMSFELCPNYKRLCTGAFLSESSNISLENIEVHYIHGFAFLIQMCENVSLRGCNFTPKEGSDRNCTSFADHIHVSGAKGKIHIESCRFSNAHDDPINIHGTFTRVKKAIDENTLVLEYVHNQQNAFRQYHKGDKVVFYNRENLEPYGDEKEFTVSEVVNPLSEGLCAKEMKVTFEETLPDEIRIPKAYAAENITYTPEVYIGGCTFEKIPTRGILCTTRKKVLIENNVFNGMTMASIYLSNDCNDWYESGAIKDMTIRNNTFYIKKSPNNGPKPAIFIDPIVAKSGKVTAAVHRNITIENNEIYLEDDKAVIAKHTENLSIRNNRIYFLKDYSSDKSDIFSCENCVGTEVTDNYTE